MDTPIIVVIAVIAIIYMWYASIIRKKNKALEALSGIDVQLKKRHDLIPNILKLAKKFMEHEKSLMTEITELRTKATQDYDPSNKKEVKEHLAAAGALAGKMGSFMVQVENYPDLKSDKNMLHAQQTYNEVEAQIGASRRFYNSAVTALNNSIQIFPGNLIAGLAKASEMAFFETDEASKEPVDVDDIMNS